MCDVWCKVMCASHRVKASKNIIWYCNMNQSTNQMTTLYLVSLIFFGCTRGTKGGNPGIILQRWALDFFNDFLALSHYTLYHFSHLTQLQTGQHTAPWNRGANRKAHHTKTKIKILGNVCACRKYAITVKHYANGSIQWGCWRDIPRRNNSHLGVRLCHKLRHIFVFWQLETVSQWSAQPSEKCHLV